jgi:ABC-type enterochelin transport system substrate-binding protein
LIISTVFGQNLREESEKNLFIGKYFDDIMSKQYEFQHYSSDHDVDEYCQRVFVVDSGMLDGYSEVNVNPKDIDVSKVNCGDTLGNVKRGYKELLKKQNAEFPECDVRVADQFSELELLMRLDVLKEMKITFDQRRNERKKFIKDFREIFEAYSQCYKDEKAIEKEKKKLHEKHKEA